MSAIYSGGVQATAIAAITAAINARIITLADGTKQLDQQSLKAWILDEFQDMLNDAEATSVSWVAGIDPSAVVATCAAVIDPAHWANRQDWPLHTNAPVQSTVTVQAVANQQAKVKRLAQGATAFFADTPAILERTLNDYFLTNIAPDIDKGITLLEENRSYICTYVTDRGEESAPSPAADLIEVDQNDTVEITIPAAPSGRNITHFRVYRSVSTNTSAGFLYLPCAADDEGWPIGTLTITDDQKAAELQEPCPSLLWDEPPADLQGLVGGANGVMAGFRGNEFCPCIPYTPYAFPSTLRITTEWPIVGLGASGQTYFVGTRGRPYLITGADSQSLSATKLEDEQACVAKRSIVAMGGGFVYASPDGLCFASASGVRVLTTAHFDREAWQALVPSSIKAAENEGCYVFTYDTGSATGTYSLDFATGKLVKLTTVGTAFFRDAITDRLYVASGLAISAMFASATKRTAAWKTRVVELPDHQSFAWLQVQSNFEGGGTVAVILTKDGVTFYSPTISSREPVRVPAGIGLEWELEVQSACRITSVTLASTTDELKAL
jgi:hypothetical protein